MAKSVQQNNTGNPIKRMNFDPLTRTKENQYQAALEVMALVEPKPLLDLSNMDGELMAVVVALAFLLYE